MNDRIEGNNFMTLLSRHDLSLENFIDMVDFWNKLSPETRYTLLRNEYDKRTKVSGNPDNASKPNYEDAHFNGEAY